MAEIKGCNSCIYQSTKNPPIDSVKMLICVTIHVNTVCIPYIIIIFDSQFHCSYLEEFLTKTREIWVKNVGNYHPFISGSRLPVTSYPVMQLPVAPAHTITSGTTTQHHHKYGLSCAYILLLCIIIYS